MTPEQLCAELARGYVLTRRPQDKWGLIRSVGFVVDVTSPARKARCNAWITKAGDLTKLGRTKGQKCIDRQAKEVLG